MKRHHSGFTLIEMLVVLLIVGVLLGITLLSPITGSLHKIVQGQSSRLEVLFAQIRDRALLENAEYGFSIGKDGQYRWWRLPVEEKEWLLLDNSPYKAYQIPEKLNIWVEFGEGKERSDDKGDDKGDDEGPMIVFFSDRTTTPFKLHIVPVDDRTQSVFLLTDGLSDVEVMR